MRFRTSLRASSVRWAAPFAVGLALFYYFGNGTPPRPHYDYAPTLVSYPLPSLYAVTYAVAACLGVWESGRLRIAGVWSMAPFRSRYRIAIGALTPTLLLSWVMLILPVSLSLARATVFPTLESLRPLFLGLILAAAHVVIGFTVGLHMPRVIAAPILAVVVWILVAFSWSTDTFWIRHVSGQYPEAVAFGEVVTIESLLPHLLLTGGVALGAALLWLPFQPVILRALPAVSVMVAGPLAAHDMAENWGASPPLLTGQAAMECVGEAPKVCVPQAGHADAATVRREAVSVLDDFRASGVHEAPILIIDRLGGGRSHPPSTAQTWRLPLTAATRHGQLRFALTRAAVQFPCNRVDPTVGRTVMLWAASVTGERKAQQNRVKQEDDPNVDQTAAARRQIEAEVAEVLNGPPQEQGEWFRHSLDTACKRVP